ncbi:MAG: UDP-phosphate alpha-N-acetyl-D-fucosaminephosphotransferase [Actinobacteria bacterium]|nr:UDP-phosphate alpha-N-acetyl-D-fucosaminephosphotransferase [Actinomycetota bacterium]
MKLGVMDVPSERSSHERPILRGLGLAVLLAMLVGGLLALAWFLAADASRWSLLAVVVATSLAAGLLGLAEDLQGLSVAVRSLLLLAIAGLAMGALVWMGSTFPEYWIAGTPIWVRALLVLYGVLFISSFINVANFMDGLNGISGLHGAVAGATFASAGLISEQGWLVAGGLVLAAGFLGFLPWNLTQPGAFLGDVGSYLLGGAIAVTSFAALMSGVPILATIGPMIIYFGDVGVTLAKRMRAGYRWDEPHKEHVYQRIQQLGYSHVAASGMTAGFTAIASLLGLASFFVPPIWWIGLLLAGLAVLAVYLRLPRLLPAR